MQLYAVLCYTISIEVMVLWHKKNTYEDFYFQKAKEENYPARSVYKLKEIEEKFQLFEKGDKVLDLGCAPGSWLIYISDKIGEQGMVTGIDMQSVNIPFKQNMQFMKADVLNLDEIEFLLDYYDVIVSDLAPATSGIKSLDAEKSLELCEEVFKIAENHLHPSGNFVCKIFESESSEVLFKKIKRKFEFAKKFRPQAVRKGSREYYIVGKKYFKHV